MDIEGVRLFVLAADLLNISAAGRRLGLAPAVAGARLSKLEKHLGADLLHRSTRKLSLSIEGAEFLPYAREILAQEQAARAALGMGSEEVSGTIRFAATSTFAQAYLMPILPEFLERYPKLNLDLKFSDLQMDLIAGGFDLALRNYAIEDSSLRARKLADDQRILCAAPSYLARYGTPQRPEDLSKHQLLVFAKHSARSLIALDKQHQSSFPPPGANARVLCDDGASMKVATIAGMGISMATYWNIHQELRAGSLVRVLPDYEVDDQSAIWLVYPKSNVLTAKVRVLIDFLLEKLAGLPVWRAP